MRTLGTYLNGSGWHHLFACWDTNTAEARHIYVDGVEDTIVSTFVAGSIDYTRTNHGVGGQTDGAFPYFGQLCEIYFNNVTYSENPALFVSGNKPIGDLTNVLATQPILYLRDPYDSFDNNSGTGGDMPVTGALAEGDASADIHY